MKKDMMYLKHSIIGVLLVCVFALAACGGPATSNSSTGTPNATATQPEVSTNPTKSVATATATTATTRKVNTPVVITPATTPTPPNGPQTILTPTPVAGGGANSQQVVLADRTLIISSVSKQNSGANSTAVTLVMAVHNTGTKAIQNQASFYELVSTEGDIFGLQSSATASFFGTIAPQSSLNGTIVFQVPSAASSGLRLLFRSEVASETVFVALK
jgi:hypothetical protein